jgi:WD40 repeat protein
LSYPFSRRFHDRPIYDVAWSSTGVIATACGDNAVRLFVELPGSNPHEPSFKLHSTLLHAHRQVCSDDLFVYPYVHSQPQDVNGIAFCPSDPTCLVSVSDDGAVKVWHVPSL